HGAEQEERRPGPGSGQRLQEGRRGHEVGPVVEGQRDVVGPADAGEPGQQPGPQPGPRRDRGARVAGCGQERRRGDASGSGPSAGGGARLDRLGGGGGLAHLCLLNTPACRVWPTISPSRWARVTGRPQSGAVPHSMSTTPPGRSGGIGDPPRTWALGTTIVSSR